MHHLLFITPPLLCMIVGAFLWPKQINWKEVLLGGAISLVLAFGMVAVGKYSAVADTELWNGEVTGTSKSVVYYSRPYDCNCRTDSKGNRTCSTCYDQGHDMSWWAESNIGDFRIEYEDCKSTSRMICLARYPDSQRWLSIRIGEPVTRQNTYENYIRAAGYGLFHRDGESDDVPEYPIDVYDHYHVDRVLTQGVSVPGNIDQWNAALEEVLKTLGPQKQANMVILLTSKSDPGYAEDVINAWEGGNKNDILIIAGFPSSVVENGPEWVRVWSWAKQDIFNVTLRDALMDNPAVWASHRAFFPEIKKQVMANFERRPMAEFEYLKDEIEPPLIATILLTILSFIIGGVMLVVFHKHEVL